MAAAMWTDLIGNVVPCKFKREPIKSIRIASIFTKQPWLLMAKENIVHIKNMQDNKMNIIPHIAWAF